MRSALRAGLCESTGPLDRDGDAARIYRAGERRLRSERGACGDDDRGRRKVDDEVIRNCAV